MKIGTLRIGNHFRSDIHFANIGTHTENGTKKSRALAIDWQISVGGNYRLWADGFRTPDSNENCNWGKPFSDCCPAAIYRTPLKPGHAKLCRSPPAKAAYTCSGSTVSISNCHCCSRNSPYVYKYPTNINTLWIWAPGCFTANFEKRH